MARVTLTDARFRALPTRKTAYDIRDGKLKGFGVRVLPSGRQRFFVHCQHDRERVWKIVGDAAANPCRGIRRYRRKGRERFLSDVEARSLSARLSAHEDTSAPRRQRSGATSERARLEDLRIHDLRHSCATLPSNPP